MTDGQTDSWARRKKWRDTIYRNLDQIKRSVERLLERWKVKLGNHKSQKEKGENPERHSPPINVTPPAFQKKQKSKMKP